jgi:hypothetical protein
LTLIVDGDNPDIGSVVAISVQDAGSDWGVAHIVIINGGDNNAFAIINSVDGLGGVTMVTPIGSPGTGYNTVGNPHTTAGSGNITVMIVNNGGTGYSLLDTANIDAGNGDGSFTINSVVGPAYYIFSVDQGTPSFTIGGNHASDFPDTTTFGVFNSTSGNNGTYTVDGDAIYFVGDDLTTITVVEAIDDNSSAGYIDLSFGEVTGITKTNDGTGYSSASGVGVLGGTGTGLTLDITVGSGLTINVTEVQTGDSDLYVTLAYETITLHE